MKTIVFNSPHQHIVNAGEFNLHFERGVPREVSDEIADVLLKYNVNFSEYAPESQPRQMIQDAEETTLGSIVGPLSEPDKDPSQTPDIFQTNPNRFFV